ncbi:DUF979 domain-containing protein [Bifidobacterium vespertilionis]|uniref:DUF979 domain-containing protein n=1 Tax=Bifidobacterium vespertilionis TaxID=2562524 RepID=A0A5J5DS68_9BIFI|nr:DUF979 domain-containing protein [Bifidobacterium vespertilionis]KAA8816185.1 DUF979 domain-containing protein [Bifidobacterium vespertilionis]KAA8821519.1 DUF979 domain-containing protein [Bifidobacterium vespertilionis]MBT1178192.1 DUF979 domain-containing protein [Bifidobacterium vespertilionis]
MQFFTDPSITYGTKLMEVFYIVMGLISVYAGVRNFRDDKKDVISRYGTCLFWVLLGVEMAFGRWIPNVANGVIIVVMVLPAIFQKVKKNSDPGPTKAESEANYQAIGMKIFIPALSIGVFAIIGALIKDLGALTGCSIGVIVGVVILYFYNRSNKPIVFLNDSERLLSAMGALCMLPMLLASLGAIFTKAGVGDVIADLVGRVIPQGNVTIGIIVFALGMMLFTMIMGNAFAAITVMTVGIGAPFVLAYGANPALIGILALTCGYCGTLLTPMAANFNIVPVAMLEMKDRFGVIKNQILPALVMIVVQIIYMLIAK